MFGIFDKSHQTRLHKKSRRARCSSRYCSAWHSAINPLEDRTLFSVDLTGSITSVPGVVSGGTRQAITYTLTNEGNSIFRGPAVVDFYAAPAGGAFNPATSTFLSSVSRGGPFLPGQTRAFTVNVPFGPQFSTGTFQVFGVINPDNAVTESNTANNLIESNAIAVTEPNFDLAVGFGNVNVPLTTTAGTTENGTVQVVVSNPSTSTATIPAGQSVNVQVLAGALGANPAVGGIVLNRNTTRINVGRLAPGQSRTITVPVQLPANLPLGAMDLIARINTTGSLAESSTLNNQAVNITPLVINAAPVVTTNPGTIVPRTPGTVGTLPGTITVGNGGTGTIGTIGMGGTGLAVGTVGTISPIGTTGAFGATPITSIGATALNSAGVLPLSSVGTTPLNALGLTPTLSIGQFTPAALGTTLSPSVMSLFVV